MTFDDTLEQGMVEFLDVDEEDTAMISMNIKDVSLGSEKSK